VDLLTRAELERLAEKEDGWHVSIFLPTHRAGQEVEEDRIRLKNLLAQAGEGLVAAGVRTSSAQELLRPASSLLQDYQFWRHLGEGLAAFLSRSFSRCYRLPQRFAPLAVVAERFHIKPLMPLLSGDGQFYVLALSQHQVRLLQGTRYSVDEVGLDDVPQGLPEALKFNDPERQLQFHTGTRYPGAIADRPAQFHGHGVGQGTDSKTDILRYFHQVDEGLRRLLAGERAPMVLAGVDYLLPLYRQASNYPRLIDEGIVGNPDELRAQELRKKAWDAVRPIFSREREEAVATYQTLAGAGSDRASADLVEIVPAAHFGRVGVLFVALGIQRWGSFDRQTSAVEVHAQHEPGDEDLLDLAAVQTLLQGGNVYAVDAETVPADAPLAAVFRY
jgi:hypothetical protein